MTEKSGLSKKRLSSITKRHKSSKPFSWVKDYDMFRVPLKLYYNKYDSKDKKIS